MNTYIDEIRIGKALENSENVDKNKVGEIIEKSRECRGITLEEAACLINSDDSELQHQLFDAARYIKDKIYGKRVVLFAPLYISNECTNNCLYCSFRMENKEIARKTLTYGEIVNETKAIEAQGHKRILLVCGEHPQKTHIEFITEAVAAIYSNTGIRRINVNAAPMEVEDFKKLKSSSIGTYQLFQETYHLDTYKKMHPSGQKADYYYRVTAMERALEAGIDDVGIGALLGLYNYKFEILATLNHIENLEKKFGIGPHTISVPRLRPADDWKLGSVPHSVSNDDFRKIVAVFRLAVPYTGIILSTRESSKFRDELLSLGVSQISAGSSTSVGGYKEKTESDDQFHISDHRSLPEVLEAICRKGYIPSFCTSCYRRNRTGEVFMGYAKEGEIHEFCQPNAILTFKENLLDYGTPGLIKLGEEIIRKALGEIQDQNIKRVTVQKLKEIENGERDIFF